MKFYRITALLLCAVLLFTMAFACTGTDGEADVSEPSETADSGSSASPDAQEGGDDYSIAYSAYAPDTVMLTVGEYDVTWDEFFFYLCSSISYLSSNGGFNWSDEAYDGMTYEELILSYATDDALSYKAVLHGSGLLGVSLDDADYAAVDADYAEAADSLGGEDALLERLRTNSHIYSRELFNSLMETEILVSHIYNKMFGEDMSLVTDETAAEHTGSGGYIMAKHILRLKTEDAVPEGEKPVPLTEAEEILAKLNNYTGDDFDGYFTGLMLENSEDSGGLASFPDGYLFQYGDMVSEFYETCLSLEVGAYSDIVETTYGYHIIYRLPIDYDAVPYAYYREGYNSSLRQIAASEMFNSVVTGWADNLSVSYSADYDGLKLPEVFKFLT